jgi:signal transduction histidine kinase
MAGPVSEHIDLTLMQPFATIRSALAMLVSAENSTYRVFAPMKSRQATMELVQSNEFLRRAIRTYARNVALISFAISLITAGLVYLALYFLIVRPIRRLSANMVAFAREPDNAGLIVHPSRRADEIGVVERQLADFEANLHSTLRHRQRLADLGLAVSKINHDLRNILASAQLFSDRLADVKDPMVQRLLPKLVKTIDRATEYSQSVLAYGKAEESKPRRRRHRLRMVVEEVHDLLDLGSVRPVEWRNEVSASIETEIDPEQMVRAILNLCRNAIQAMQRNGTARSGICRLTISAEESGGAAAPRIVLRVADTGPGIEEAIRQDLFRPFKKSASHGGAGLGLVIAAEILRAHGGGIEVERSSEAGTIFRLEFPAHAE